VQRIFGLPGGAMHDPLAVAALVDPGIVTFQPMHVAVELRGEHTYGMTVCDARAVRSGEPEAGGRRVSPPNADVAVAVDPERFWELFLGHLASYP
jgi:inosine-uridine nucleoside N-ribohydrolase